MASPKETSIRVAVVGLSGQSQEGGGGVGKSCLCNRFVRSAQDDYSEEHLSLITSSDFYGPIINGQHILYWGNTRKVQNSGPGSTSSLVSPAYNDKKIYDFEVIEHTLFRDDGTFAAFGTGEDTCSAYIRRIAKTKISSSGKIAYLNRDQLEDVSVGGTKFEAGSFPSPFEVDSFIVAADVSRHRPEQTKWLEKVLPAIAKLKKPFVVVACKCDRLLRECLEELEMLVKKYTKGAQIVETSAREAVNVDAAFLALTSAVRRNGKHGMFPGKAPDGYTEASRIVADERSECTASFQALLQREVKDFQVTWPTVVERLKGHDELQQALASVGRDAVRRIVIAHAKELKAIQRVTQLAMYTGQMEWVFEVLVPEATGNTRFEDAVDIVREHSAYHEYFAEVDMPWDSTELLANPPQGGIVPNELLDTRNGREAFEHYMEKVMAAKQSAGQATVLREMLDVCKEDLIPGMSWSSVASVLKSANKSADLNFRESVRTKVFSEFDFDLLQECCAEFRECILENIEVFDNCPQYGATPSSDQLKRIDQSLKGLLPYERLKKCANERNLVLMNMLAEKQRPPLREDIARTISQLPSAQDILSLDKQWELCPKDQAMSTVLIGDGMVTTDLVEAIKESVRKGELPSHRLPRTMVCLSPEDALQKLVPSSSEIGKPNGFLAVFANEASWSALEAVLDTLMLNDDMTSPTSKQPLYRGAPIVIIHIRDQTMSLDDRKKLKKKVSRTLARLQCPSIKVTCGAQGDSFISYAANAIVMLRSSVDHRYSALYGANEHRAKEDLTLGLCCLADDTFNANQILSSLFSLQLCWKTPVRGLGPVREAFRGLICVENRLKLLHVRLISSLDHEFVKKNPQHGYIALHSSERPASAHLAHTMVLLIPRAVPCMLLGSTHGVDDASEIELDVMAATEQVAEDSASQLTWAAHDFHLQDAPFKSFFESMWGKRQGSLTHQGVMKKSRSENLTAYFKPISPRKSSNPDSAAAGQRPEKVKDVHSLISGFGAKRALSAGNLVDPAANTESKLALLRQAENNRSLTPDLKRSGLAHPLRRLSDGRKPSDNSEPVVTVSGRSHVYSSVSPSPSHEDMTRTDSPAAPLRTSSSGKSERDPLPVSSQISKLQMMFDRRSSEPVEVFHSTPNGALSQPALERKLSVESNPKDRQPPRRWAGENRRAPVQPRLRQGGESGDQPRPARPDTLKGVGVRGTAVSPVDGMHFVEQHFANSSLQRGAKLHRGQQLSAHSPNIRQKYVSPVSRAGENVCSDASSKHNRYSTPLYDNVIVSPSNAKQRKSYTPHTSPPNGHSGESTSPGNQGSAASQSTWYEDASPIEVSPTSSQSQDTARQSNASIAPPSQRRLKSTPTFYEVVQDDLPSPPTPARIQSRNARPLQTTGLSGQLTGLSSSRESSGVGGMDFEEDAPAIPPRCYISDDDDEGTTDDLLDSMRVHSDSSTSTEEEAPPPLPPRRYLETDSGGESEEGITPLKAGQNKELRTIMRLSRSKSYMHNELLNKHQKKQLLRQRRRQQKDEEKEQQKKEKREREEKRRLEKQFQKDLRAKKKAAAKAKRSGVKEYRPDGDGPGSSYFGLYLHELPRRTDGSSIPLFVEMCLEFIEENGFSTGGIYRVSGKKDLVDKLQEDFPKDPEAMQLDPETTSVHVVASAVKSFFRRLPDPLIPTPIIGPLTKALGNASDLEHQLKDIKMLVNAGVPSGHLTVLKYLCGHLHRLCKNHEVNKMTHSNLSIVFWPTLMRPEHLNLRDFTVAQEMPLTLQRLMSLIIEHYPIVFDDHPLPSPSTPQLSPTAPKFLTATPYKTVGVTVTPILTRKA